MTMTQTSYHSVSKVVHEGKRCCVSNYYLSSVPAKASSYFHVTSFYGRPEQPVRDLLLGTDAFMRNLMRKVTQKRIVKTTHIYDKGKRERNLFIFN